MSQKLTDNRPSYAVQNYAEFQSYFQKYHRSRHHLSWKSPGMNKLTLQWYKNQFIVFSWAFFSASWWSVCVLSLPRKPSRHRGADKMLILRGLSQCEHRSAPRTRLGEERNTNLMAGAIQGPTTKQSGLHPGEHWKPLNDKAWCILPGESIERWRKFHFQDGSQQR